MTKVHELTRSELSEVLLALGASLPKSVVTQDEVDTIKFPYQRDSRRYHDVDHLDDMSQGKLPEALQSNLLAVSLSLMPEAADQLVIRLSSGTAEEAEKAKAEKVLEQASAILRFAGFLHDSAYKQIDGSERVEDVWPLVLRRVLGKDLKPEVTTGSDGKPVFTTHLTEAGKANRMTKIIADIFAVSDNGVSTKAGGNEFDSAVVAAKLLEKHSAMATAKVLEEHGIDEKTILAVVACIAATYPFQPATDDQYPDGYMGHLAARIYTASQNAEPPIELKWADINKMMLLAVQTANDDVADFFGNIPKKENASFVDIAHGAVLLKAEEITDLHSSREEEATIQDLMRLATLSRSAPYLYKQMQDPTFAVQPKNVPHFYLLRDKNGKTTEESHYPAKQEYEDAVERVKLYTKQAVDYFEAKKVGVTVVAALERLVRQEDEEPVKVLDFVKGRNWERWPPDEVIAQLSEEDKPIYDALAGGRNKGYVSKLEIDKSPTAGVIFGFSGKAGADALYNLDIDLGGGTTKKLQDLENVETKEQANQIISAVIEKIGMDGLKIITDELARVAVLNNNATREQALLDIPGQFREFSTRVTRPTVEPITEERARGHG